MFGERGREGGKEQEKETEWWDGERKREGEDGGRERRKGVRGIEGEGKRKREIETNN